MTCASCGWANAPGSRFCSGCGASLAPRCAACGAENAAGARFCNGCGAALTAQAQPAAAAIARKIVTIVFADLIGSVSLHERLDAESARRFMDRYHRAMTAAVEMHGGKVIQLLGDGVLAAFGVPRVAEDDAIRAVRAGVGMQRAFRELAREQSAAMGNVGLRVAVNTGEIVVGDDENSVMGDPTNVAARLQQEARDGDVIVGEATQRLVAELVTLAPLGSFALRGREEAVAAYRVVSLDRPASQQAIAFVGRDDELRRLVAVYDAAVATPAARLAVLLGSPGLGKSRLVTEFTRRAGERATVLTARCDQAGGATFAPLAEALRALLRIDEGAGGDVLRAAIDSVVAGDDAERTRIATGIGALLAGTPAPPEETFFVVRRLLAALATVRPVVLVIDDLHWAEPLLLDLVEHLVQWSTGVPLLVLVAARPELRDARSSLATQGSLVAEVVALSGLDASAATRLAANVIGGAELPAALAGRVLATSEGNPLFVAELVRMLVLDGTLVREGDRWITTVEIAKLEMPPTIHVLLAARIERLRPEERSVLERAAVIGRQFSRAAVAHLLPREAYDLDARLEALRRSELIEPDTGWYLGEPGLRFHHVLIRDAAYRRVLKETRAELHERLADWIVSRVGEAVEHDEAIGWHLEQAHQCLLELGPLDAHGRELGERAAKHLGAAGRRALARDDLPLAGGLLGRAIERLAPDDPARADLALDWCEALLAAGEVGVAARAVEELGRIAVGSERLRAWHSCFAGQLAALTDPQSLRATVDSVASAAEALAAAGDAAGEAKAHSVHAAALARLGAIGACETALDLALAAARRARDRRRSNAVLAGAPVAALWGPSPVTRASGRCLDVVRVLRITQGAPAVEAVALRCQAVLETLRGRGEAARRMIASSRRMVEELGIAQQLLEADVFAGHIELLEGDAEAAERCLRAAYEGLRERGLGIDAARAAALLGRALLTQGRAAEAETLSHESEALAGDDLKAAIAWRGVRAEALARRGESATAVELARAAVAIAAATDALLDHADARLALSAALRAAGRDAEADAEQTRALEIWEAKGATLLVERVQRTSERLPAAAPADRDGARQSARRRVRPNAATAHAARLDAALAARDADAARDAHTANLELIHHPTGRVWGRDASVGRFRAMMEQSAAFSFVHEPLATLGDSLALFRATFEATEVAVDTLLLGAVETDRLAVTEARADGQASRIEVFAGDRLADAIARLYERYAELLPEGPERERAAATARSVAELPRNDGWPFAADIEFFDHRVVGMGRMRGAEAVIQSFRPLFDLTTSSVARFDDILGLRSDALLVHWTHSGVEDRSGGAFERRIYQLWIFGADGLVARWEQFDADREAEALARFDALTGERPGAATRRRVRANAATRGAARLEAAIAAHDEAAMQRELADDYESLHHPTGVLHGRDAPLAAWRELLQARDGVMTFEPLATLGEALALIRGALSHAGVRTGDLDVGPVRSEELVLVAVNPRGEAQWAEIFGEHHLADAIARLYERHAELLPDGPERARAAATARSIALGLRAPVGLSEAGISSDVEFNDRRRIGIGSSRGLEAFLRGRRAQLTIHADLALRVHDVLALRPDAYLVSWTTSGTDRNGGGAFENHFLMLRAYGPDGLLRCVEWFDPDRADLALARFEELTAPRAPARRVRSNAATAAVDRIGAVHAARDLAALAQIMADDIAVVHHPTRVEFGRDAALTRFASFYRAEDLVLVNDPLATLGDSLALLHCSTSLSALAADDVDAGFGAIRIDTYVVTEVDARGQQRRVEIFADDHLAEAIARLYERYAELLPEGPERTRAAATARSIASMMTADIDRHASALAPEVEYRGYGVVALPSARGAERLIAGARAFLELAADMTRSVDDILALRSDALLIRRTTAGTDRSTGGPYEKQFLALWMFGSDGLIARIEQFDPERAVEALARFDELTAPHAESARRARRVRPNAAVACAERVRAAARARDLDGIAALLADEFQVVDNRSGLVIDREGGLARWRLLFETEGLTVSSETLATLGDSLGLARDCTSFDRLADAHLSFGASETRTLIVLESNARGQGVRIDVFPEARLPDAIARLYERHAELLPEGPEHDRAARTAQSLARSFAWDGADPLPMSADFSFTDRRRVGFGSGGAELLTRIAAAAASVSDDAHDSCLDVLAAEPGALLAHWTTTGTDRIGGGAFEWPHLRLAAFGADGLVSRLEAFDVEALDAALARFDELAASRAPARRVRPNAATAHAARMDAAVAARDLDAFLGLLADGARGIHHPTGVAYEERESRRAYEILLRNETLVFAHEPLATLGDSLALCRGNLSIGGSQTDDLPFGASNMDSLVLMDVDASGRRVSTEFFALDKLGDAVCRLYARYAELLPDGGGGSRAAMTARAVAAVLPADLDAIAAVLAPEIEYVDHRPLGLGSARGAARYLRGLRSLLDTTSGRPSNTDELIAASSDALLLRRTGRGILREGGGEYEHHFLLLWVFGSDGRVTHIEMFESDRDVEALARFDELTAEPQESRFANAAWRAAQRQGHVMMERDEDAAVAARAPTFRHDDRRAIVGVVLSGEDALANLRLILAAKSLRIDGAMLATRGERLVLRRVLMSGEFGAGGPVEYDYLQITEIDTDNRITAVVMFDPGDLAAAHAELDRRYAAGEGAPYADLLAFLDATRAAAGTLDFERLARLLPADFTTISHRRFANTGERFTRDRYVASMAAMREMGVHGRDLRLDHLRLTPRAVFADSLFFGTRDGGDFEIPNVMVFEHDGRVVHGWEMFDDEQLDRALARFDELTTVPPEPRFANAAARALDRLGEAWCARSIERVAALLAPAFRNDDRRGVLASELDREGFLASFGPLLARDARVERRSELLATRGERLALAHALDRVDPELGANEGPFEIEMLQVLELDDAGRIAAWIVFDPSDLDAAYAELDARYHVGEAAPHASVAAGMREFGRAFAARNWEALAARCAPDLVVHDHRLLGWESLHGPVAYVQALRALVELAPDTRLRLDHVAMNERGYLVATVWVGTREGGAFEEPSLMVGELDDAGRIRRFDAYDLDRPDDARARFAELATSGARDLLRIPPNAATRAMDRFGEAATGRDWDAIASLLAPEFLFDDRRRGIRDGGDRAKMLASVRLAARSGARAVGTTLATAGDRLALQHIRFSISDGDTLVAEIETLQVVEIDADGRLVATVTFDPDDRRAASAELAERYGASAVDESRRASRLAMMRAIRDHDLDRVRATLPEGFVYHDHRRLGAGRLEGEAYLAWMAGLFEQSSDALIAPLYVIASEPHGTLSVGHTFGTRVEGGAFESVYATVAGSFGVELYDLEDLDRARVRFEELGREHAARRADPQGARLESRAQRSDPKASEVDALAVPPNAATRARIRTHEAFLARDWAAMRALVSDDFVWEDRGKRALLRGDVELWIASSQQSASPGVRRETEILATLGDRLALERILYGGAPGGVEYEKETLRLTELDAGGRIRTSITFDPEDRRAASVEMTDRFLRSDEAPSAAAAGLAALRALADHDLEPLREALPDDFFVDDHRRFGMGRIDGAAAFIQSFAALFEQSADLMIEGLYTVAVGEHGILDVAHMFGTLTASGGDFESVYARLLVFRNDRFVGLELFDVEDLHAARARFEALRPTSR